MSLRGALALIGTVALVAVPAAWAKTSVSFEQTTAQPGDSVSLVLSHRTARPGAARSYEIYLVRAERMGAVVYTKAGGGLRTGPPPKSVAPVRVGKVAARATRIRIRVPKRPNGVKGWVRSDALGALTVNHRLIDVNKRTLRLRVFDHGKVVMTARIGVGKAGTITPSGHFYVREKFHVKGVPLYGPRAIGTSAYAPTLSDWPGGGVVGLHGTNQPGLIPGRPSHGCIRLKNRDILRLYRVAERGTPIHIHN